jgi:hypothetical protein
VAIRPLHDRIPQKPWAVSDEQPDQSLEGFPK